jgi:hypothetical protein
MTALLPILVAIIGLILYFAATNNGKVSEVGRIMFMCGLFIFLLEAGPRVVSALK